MRHLLSSLFLLLVWQLAVMLFKTPVYLLPSPLLILQTLWHNRGELLLQAWPTVVETLVGLLIGTAIGAIVAALMSVSRVCRSTLFPVILVSQAIPIIAIAPLFVLWFDYGMASKIATSAVALFFPIASSLYDGLRRTPSGMLEMAQCMQAKRWRQWYWIELPAALPSFSSGLRMACVWAPMAAVVGEWVGSERGLGFLIIQANARMDTPLMFSALVFLIVFSLLLYVVVNKLLQVLIPWGSR